jgi:hypothetical protein
MLTKKELQQIKEYGLSVNTIVNQLETFATGIPYTNVVTAASVGNGIEAIPEAHQQKLINLFEEESEHIDLVKFVPASGAATRMFKFLHQFLQDYNPEVETLNKFLKRNDNPALVTFFNATKDFPFVNEVRKKIREIYPDYKRCTKGMRCYLFVKTMLDEKGLNYANMPKGLIPFHKYSKYATTAFEEQLYEAAFYTPAKEDVHLHFTFSEKHVPFFKEEFESVKNRVSKKTKTNFNISYSFQKKETDTIAVNENNTPFKDEKGALVFRPSGHGALLENLNDVDTDLIFIKNIDNVVAEEYIDDVVYYKKLLAGKLLWVQTKIFNYLKQINKSNITEKDTKELKSFLWNELNIKDIPETFAGISKLLNRPIRVCGVVKNTGAPGGGPFWVKELNGNTTLQIVETAQIDMRDAHQNAIVKEATHFNPVDIICGVRNYKGEKFDLLKFSDPLSGFISLKSQNGKPLKALELPGLWNGAMANWNTILVEVPLHTFNPVKTVNDLLSKEHRPNL